MTQPWYKRVLALASITGWMVWGYFRLRPPQNLLIHGQLLVSQYDLWSYKSIAYSDVVKLYQTRHLFMHLVPYAQNRIQYPVVTGSFMSMMAAGHGIGSYFLLTAVVFWLMAILIYFLLERLAPRQALLFAVTPLLLVYGLLNWDLLGIALMVGGWYCYRRRSFVASAVLFALAVFAKLFPVFFLPFIAAELWRRRQGKVLARMVGAFAATSLAINLPFAIANFSNWAYFFTFNATRPLAADIYNNEWIHGLPVTTVDALSLAIVAAAGALFMWHVYRGGRVIDAATFTFVIFLFFNKVYSPQYTLWVFVLALMANWPVWSELVLVVTGLIDYLNSFALLYMLTSNAPNGTWYVRHVFEIGVLYRYVSLAVTAVGAAASPRQAAHGERSPLALGRTM